MTSETKSSEQKNFLNLLTSGYKQEILEELVDNPGYIFTINELAEKVSGSYNSVNNFLRELEEFEIVSFRKKGGSYLIEYNPDSRYHEVIKSLLRADNEPLEQAAERYAEKLYNQLGLKNQIRSIILFGSVARGTAGPNSDIDILVLSKQNTDTERLKEKARKTAQQLSLNFELVPVIEDSKEFKNNFKHGKRFETNVKKDGIVLEGEAIDFEN